MSLDRGDHTHLGHTEQGDQMSYTEADLLRAMASTGDLNQQRYLMGALEEMRSDRHQVQAGAQQVDFAPPNHVGEYRPSHPHHQGPFGNSANTDWLTEMTQSNEGMAEHMLTMGSRFFVGCHPEVKSDPVEYMTQALGVARIAAGQFDDIEGAINMFMSHVANLNRVDITKAVSYTHLDVYKRQAYICATGTGCWGIVVTQQMEDQTTNNEPWDLTGPPNPEDILGGHDVLIIPTMDADGNFEVVTWGQRQKVTQRCFKYVSEELDSTIVGAQTGKLNKYGVDYDKLESYMKLLDNNPLLPAAK